MKLSHRIFLGYFIIVALAGYFLLKSVQDELRPAVRQSMEETMVDTANLLAEVVAKEVTKVVAKEVTAGTLMSTSNFAEAMNRYLARRPSAVIWSLKKNTSSYRVYITDADGMVLYDSGGDQTVGKDYSQWNDVYLTLRGEYGARSTPSDPEDESTSVMYIAAPIMSGDTIIGVLTVSKANISVLPFIELSQRNITKAGLIMLVIALVLGWLFSAYLSRSTAKLVAYANKVRDGDRAVLPAIAERELSQLGDAIESMRLALEGKEYVERYVHSLTHEVKSPLTGIMGASELLQEDMPLEDRSRFISTIKDETQRIQHIVDRLLDLARVEQQQVLERRELIFIDGIVGDIVSAHMPQCKLNGLQFEVSISPCERVYGDAFLVHQAINNVVDNAVAFSPKGGTIKITGTITSTVTGVVDKSAKAESVSEKYRLVIQDNGDGIPDYATEKVYDRFYSLPRPRNGKKSSGLGLSFVREVVKLHQGSVAIANYVDVNAKADVKGKGGIAGCKVSISFPLL
jgi:two-component system sensor histidine kinase CreC